MKPTYFSPMKSPKKDEPLVDIFGNKRQTVQPILSMNLYIEPPKPLPPPKKKEVKDIYEAIMNYDLQEYKLDTKRSLEQKRLDQQRWAT
jgi:hypothetical protein